MEDGLRTNISRVFPRSRGNLGPVGWYLRWGIWGRGDQLMRVQPFRGISVLTRRGQRAVHLPAAMRTHSRKRALSRHQVGRTLSLAAQPQSSEKYVSLLLISH